MKWCMSGVGKCEGMYVCVVMVRGRNVSTYLQLCTCAMLPMCRVGHTYSERGRSYSRNSLVVGIGSCERTDRERGSMATQRELPM